MSNINPQYRKEIAWWFAELGREGEVDHYLALFPMLNSRLAKFAVGILLWNMTGKIDINNPEDVQRVQQLLLALNKSPMFHCLDNTFNELEQEEVCQMLGLVNATSKYDIGLSNEMVALSKDDSNFPERLRALGSDCPNNLFCLGNLELIQNEDSVAIIGARSADEIGIKTAYDLGIKYASDCVISGLARGIDTAAHWGCVNADGQTIAVVGTGLDRVHPKENRLLQKKIIEAGGLIISEQPIGVKASPKTLIARTGIQMALASKIIVVECDRNSGTMHAVNFAIKYGKPIFALDNDWSGNRYLIDNHFANPI